MFGDKPSGAYLLKFSWFPIERHVMVRGKASPDDPRLRTYWAEREKTKAKDLTPKLQRLARKQGCICPLCGISLFTDEEIHQHHRKPKGKGGEDADNNLTLVHLYCHQQIHSGSTKVSATTM